MTPHARAALAVALAVAAGCGGGGGSDGPPAPVPPAAPGALTPALASSTSIRLSWTDLSADETGFELERAPSADGPWTFVAVCPPGSTSYLDTGLSPGATYHHRVRAVGPGGASAWKVSSLSIPAPPAAPTALVASPLSSSAIHLAWTDAASDESGYEIERRSDPVAPWTSVALLGPDASAHDDTGLAAATSYEYRVRAYGTGGTSAAAEATATTAALSARSSDSATAALWHLDDGGVGTDQYLDDASGHGRALVTGANASMDAREPMQTTGRFGGAFDFGYTSGGNHLMQGPCGISFPANELTIELWFRTSDWGPTTLFWSSGTNAWVWIEGGNASFRLGEGNVSPTISTEDGDLRSGAWHHLAATFDGSTLSLYVDGVRRARESGTANRLEEAAHCFAGVHPVANPLNATVTIDEIRVSDVARSAAEIAEAAGVEAPAAPSAPPGVATSPISPYSVHLTWQAPAGGAQAYAIQHSPSAAGPWTHLALASAGATAHDDGDASPGQTTWYRLRALGASAASPWSAVVSATTPVDPLGAPAALDVEAISSTALRLTWEDRSAGENGFEVERGEYEAGPFAWIDTAQAGATSFEDAGLQARTAYWYRVRAVDASSRSAWSDVVRGKTWSAAAPLTADASTLALWHLDEGTGTTAADSSGKGHSLALGLEGFPSTVPQWTSGRLGGALAFDHATDDYAFAQVVFSFLPDQRRVTVESWLRIPANTGSDQIILTCQQSYENVLELALSGGQVSFAAGSAFGRVTAQTTGATVLDGEWHHVAGTANGEGGGASVYVDGVLAATGTGSAWLPIAFCWIGGSGWRVGNSFELDELRISSVTRTAAEIAAAAGLP